jgi:hypothetical protein
LGNERVYSSTFYSESYWLFKFANFRFPKIENVEEKKVLGKGAVVSCLAKYLYPSALIRDRFLSYHQKKRLTNLIVIEQASETVNKRLIDCIVAQSDEVMNGDLHCRLFAAQR